jgi:enoyl-[acyl-carrier-protein] reductase (NADH)
MQQGVLEVTTRVLAAALGRAGITVNAIASRYFATLSNAKEVADHHAEQSPGSAQLVPALSIGDSG